MRLPLQTGRCVWCFVVGCAKNDQPIDFTSKSNETNKRISETVGFKHSFWDGYFTLELAMSIEGVSHITFIVSDVERMARFLCQGLGATEVYDSKKKNYSVSREKFFVLGGVWMAAMEGVPPSERSYRHLAFKVSESELPRFEEKLRTLDVEIKEPRPRVDGEGMSLYFYDFDNHLFELHTGTLEQRLERYQSEF